MHATSCFLGRGSQWKLFASGLAWGHVGTSKKKLGVQPLALGKENVLNF